MAYAPIATEHIRDPEMRRAMRHASDLLADVYTMLNIGPTADTHGGKCNFSIGLVLACLIDGLATEIWPIAPAGGRHQLERMEILMARMPWGHKRDGWITRLGAARVLYHEVRNPLVHNLGANTHWRGRPRGFQDAAIVLETRTRKRLRADEIDELKEWNPKWPVIWMKPHTDPGPRRYVVSAPALYWHTKWLTADLASDANMLSCALERRKRRRVK